MKPRQMSTSKENIKSPEATSSRVHENLPKTFVGENLCCFQGCFLPDSRNHLLSMFALASRQLMNFLYWSFGKRYSDISDENANFFGKVDTGYLTIYYSTY